MNEVGLQTVFRAVMVSRLTYASPAWRGFITATDRQRVDAFLRRCKRCSYFPPDLPDFDELLEESDDRLFRKTLNNPYHRLMNTVNNPYRSPQNRITITSENAHTTDNCLHTVDTYLTRISAIADKPRVLVCKVVEVWQDFLSKYVDKKFTYICYIRLIRHE